MDFLTFREPVSAWTHGIWFLLAIPATIFLGWKSRGDRAKQLSLLVYGLALIACFGASTLCHGVRLPEQHIAFYVLLDHIGIFLMIAGTCTAIVFTLLSGPWKWGILGGAWLVAAIGIVSNVVLGTLQRNAFTGLYLGMGWGFALCYYELARVVSHRTLRPVVVGGAFYSLGAVLNLVRWPVVWPGVIQEHEVLHLFVMAGSLIHYFFILDVIVPFERRHSLGRRSKRREAAVEPVLPLVNPSAEAVGG